MLNDLQQEGFYFSVHKRFPFKRMHGDLLTHGATALRMFERMVDDISHVWHDCNDSIKSRWWDNSWGVGDRSLGCSWFQVGWKTLTPKRAEGEPEILNIPKILGGVVAATTNGEPLVESSISVNITTIVWVWIMMQGNIEQVPWVPFVLLWPFIGMPNPCASTKSH